MQAVSERLQCKTFENFLKNRLLSDYSLSRAESTLLARDLTDVIDDLEASLIKPGQAVFWAVSAKEGPSIPINDCAQVKVILTMFSKEDLKQDCVPDLRRSKILRMSKEAFSQGALLSQEDLAAILCVDNRTIRRDVAHLKGKGINVPTRGMVKDIGRAPTHKSQAIKLFLAGKQFSEITRELYHSATSILRYLRAFILVASLKAEGLTNQQIISMNLASESTIKEYLSIYHSYLIKEPAKLEMLKKISIKKGAC